MPKKTGLIVLILGVAIIIADRAKAKFTAMNARDTPAQVSQDSRRSDSASLIMPPLPPRSRWPPGA